jgi:uncharacterized protein (DUF433 family)
MHNCWRNLKWGTAQENSDDKRRHGTIIQEEDHYQSKLTKKLVYRILTYRDNGASSNDIAARFHVHPSLIGAICKGVCWKPTFRKWVADHDGKLPSRSCGSSDLREVDVYELLTRVDRGDSVPTLVKEYGLTKTDHLYLIASGSLWHKVFRKWVTDHDRRPRRPNRLNQKLTDKQVLSILERRRRGEKGITLAEEFKVSPPTISCICKGVYRKKVYQRWRQAK